MLWGIRSIAKEQIGISYKDYCENDFYTMTRSQQEREANFLHRKQKRDAVILKKLCKTTGMNSKAILADIDRLNQMEIYPVNLPV